MITLRNELFTVLLGMGFYTKCILTVKNTCFSSQLFS